MIKGPPLQNLGKQALAYRTFLVIYLILEFILMPEFQFIYLFILHCVLMCQFYKYFVIPRGNFSKCSLIFYLCFVCSHKSLSFCKSTFIKFL